MTNLNKQRFILITRATRLQALVSRFNTWSQAQFYLEHSQTGGEQISVQDYLDEHNTYLRCIQRAELTLKNLGRFGKIEREFLPNFKFSNNDIVVVIGQDGLVANTLKYLQGQAVIAINPDPDRWDGKLLPFEINDLATIAKKVSLDKADDKSITFAQARTNDGQTLLAVNDLFVGPKSHTSASYTLHWGKHSEQQSSSGIIISTGFGSTGWLKSILTGAMGVTGYTLDTYTLDKNKHQLQQGFAWDDKRLQFAVREPFPSKTTGADHVFGGITERKHLSIESHMPEHGIIFSDGIEQDYINFNSGCVVSISVAKTQGRLVLG